MNSFKSEVAKIKHEVLREVSHLTLTGRLESEIDRLPRTLTDAGITRYRCCVYKERAILAERVKFALGFSPREVGEEERLGAIAAKSLAGHHITSPVLDIIGIACDRCPIDRYLVTDACRGCVAHFCVNTCPKKAITIVGRRAYIDQEKCVECGRCSRACYFHAIVEVSRPCERSCPTGAIKPGPNRNSVIDREFCTTCGACLTACPFGAIANKSQLPEVIRWLQAGEQVVAALAPSIAGQFGAGVSAGQVLAALAELGFTATAEVARGADQVAELEAKEFSQAVSEKEWLASSCCPAFVSFVRKSYPDLVDHLAPIPSPMVVLGQMLKAEDPGRKVVFIGPCVAKKEEALGPGTGIDAVLTFEELAAFLAAREIDPAVLSPVSTSTGTASAWGRGFLVSGGVAAAVEQALKEQGATVEFKPVLASGLEECKRYLNLARAGKLPGNFLEGMACEGGCVGGPAALVGPRESARAVEKFYR
ncbi:Ion-translocating oxidoreductase complex subunit B [Moorella thermoacetica]|uniref:4Fe-4S dicluster domain-containing protein n=1 Tax=Neomoorella thermoacetica TaxID=1525 RepID=UPI0030CDF57D